ncbi:hypothetical protein FACS189421_04140 [Bacteroidia bacterium]|nr:hypothetical protein FACS189421_04140 [Bacteroidia bacterium]GHT48100.1 hypothetical protein FACS189440_10820 [Bacteroidia bacterium]
MKLLFITTYGITIPGEHFFTLEVVNGLIESKLNMVILTVLCDKDTSTPLVITENYKGTDYFILKLPDSYASRSEKIVDEIKNTLLVLNPAVIHSNMIEGYELEAANQLNIPVVYTIHIGGFICPRGGGNGFLYYNDEICPTTVSHKNCLRCCCRDLPGKDFMYNFLRLFSVNQRLKAYQWVQKRPFMLLLTPLLLITGIIEDSLKKIEKFKQSAAIISANIKLKEILEKNGIRGNVVVIPHGVKKRNRLPLLALDGKVKFYYLGRISYAKGLHILLKALEPIPQDQYELHIIGDAEKRGKEQRYYGKLKRTAKKLPVVFHERLPNSAIESLIKDYHVMIHPAIVLEVFGIAIAESISMGRPVLATKCGGPEMQIIPKKNGWLIEPNNRTELQKSIQYILENKDEIAVFSKNCEIPLFSHYIQSLHKLYEEI